MCPMCNYGPKMFGSSPFEFEIIHRGTKVGLRFDPDSKCNENKEAFIGNNFI